MQIRLIFIVAAAALGFAADAPSINGKWQVHSSISGTEWDQVCTLAQKDDALTGNCASDQGTFDITGNVSGNKLTFSYKSQYNGTPITLKYEGTLEAAKISGSVNVPEFGAGGDFTATQAK